MRHDVMVSRETTTTPITTRERVEKPISHGQAFVEAPNWDTRQCAGVDTRAFAHPDGSNTSQKRETSLSQIRLSSEGAVDLHHSIAYDSTSLTPFTNSTSISSQDWTFDNVYSIPLQRQHILDELLDVDGAPSSDGVGSGAGYVITRRSAATLAFRANVISSLDLIEALRAFFSCLVQCGIQKPNDGLSGRQESVVDESHDSGNDGSRRRC